MREIRLGAWDRTNKCWRDVEEFIVGKNGAVVAINDVNGTTYQVFKGQIDLLQSTGIKDKNGKDVYEGDIVKWRSHPDKQKVGEVRYEQSAFRIFYYDSELERDRGFPSIHRLDNLTSVEVIGNIYESPELLANQKGQ